MTNGVLGMAVTVLFLFLMVGVCASETKENFDRALAKEIDEQP